MESDSGPTISMNAGAQHYPTLFLRWNNLQYGASGCCPNGIILIMQALFKEWQRAHIINPCH